MNDNIVVYDSGEIELKVSVEDESIWLRQNEIAMLFNKVPDVKVTIYTKVISKQLKLDLEKYNSQYNNLKVKKFDNSHDRFLSIDENEVYHIGASLKDLGKKWFGFSKMDMGRLK